MSSPGLPPLLKRTRYERYSRRIEESRLPKDKAAREAYAQMVGEDGFYFLDALEAPDAPREAQELPMLENLRRTWQRHYERTAREPAAAGAAPAYRVRFKASRDLPPAAEGIESPYDAEARYRHKRDTQWTGYMVHVSETCEPTTPHLLTHVHTTPATVHEAQCTEPIQQALVDKDVPPREHFVDAAYISSELLVHSRDDHGIALRGPTRPSQGWQTQVEGAYTLEQFAVDWAQQQVRCPQGHRSVAWWEHGGGQGSRPIIVEFDKHTCGTCPVRPCCTRAEHTGRGYASRPRPSTRHWQRRRPGLRARKASNFISGGRVSKGRSPRGSVPLACAGPGIGAWRRPTCSTSRSPPRSILTALSHGSTSAHGP
jgi:transposase